MSIRKQGRKSIVIAMIMTLLGVGLLPNIAKADQIIDTNERGIITVHKYNGEEIPGLEDYPTQAQAQAAIQAALDAGEITGMAGVGFSYLKIGEVAQYTKNEGSEENVTKIGYSLDQDTIDFLGLGAGNVDFNDGTTDFYTSTTLQTALAAKSQTDVETFMNGVSTNMPLTGADGTSTVTDLDLGLYLFVESLYPANAISITAPFLVSVPMTDNDEDGNFNWIYDIDVFPKNQVQPIEIDKNIVDEDGNEVKEYDAEIGESVPFLVRADVPLQIGKLLTYKITDTLSAGLTYDAGFYGVQGVKADGNRETLVAGIHFEFTHDGQELTWDFITEAMADAEGQALYKSIEIRYTATPNKDAIVGQPGNPNNVKLEYSKNTNVIVDGTTTDETETTTPVELPKVYTYAIDLLKYGDSDTGNPLEGVKFELLDKDEQKINVSQQVAGVDGSYYLDPDGTATIITGEDGRIYIKGLETGEYFLKETATNQGYNLLAELITITITSTEGEYTESEFGTYAPIDGGKYFKDAAGTNEFMIPEGLELGTYVNFGRTDVYREDGTKVEEMYIQVPLAWEANYAMDGNTGVIVLLVNNTRGFEIPKTGDTTALILYGVGAALAITAMIGTVATKKKKKHEEIA